MKKGLICEITDLLRKYNIKCEGYVNTETGVESVKVRGDDACRLGNITFTVSNRSPAKLVANIKAPMVAASIYIDTKPTAAE